MEHHIYGRLTIFSACVGLFNYYNVGGSGGLVVKWCLTLVIPRTIVCQAPLPMGFSRQEYWSDLPFPSPEDLPSSGVELVCPALAGGLFTTEPSGKWY